MVLDIAHLRLAFTLPFVVAAITVPWETCLARNTAACLAPITNTKELCTAVRKTFVGVQHQECGGCCHAVLASVLFPP